MGRRPATEEEKFKQLVVLKGPQKWIDWVEESSRRTELSVTEMFDEALKEYIQKRYSDLPHPGRKIPAKGRTKKSTTPAPAQ